MQTQKHRNGKDYTMNVISVNIEQLVNGLNAVDKDALYRRLWLDHVKEDVANRLEETKPDSFDVDSEEFDEAVEAIAHAYVYDGKYDCNLTYWENIDNLIDHYLAKDLIS